MHKYIRIYNYTCTHTCVHTYIHTHTHIHTYIHLEGGEHSYQLTAEKWKRTLPKVVHKVVLRTRFLEHTIKLPYKPEIH